MKNRTFVILLILSCWSCTRNREQPSIDTDRKGYSGGLITMSDQYLFLNKSGMITRADEKGDNKNSVVNAVGQPLMGMEAKDSILVIRNHNRPLYLITASGLAKELNVILPQSYARICNAAMFQDRVVISSGVLRNQNELKNAYLDIGELNRTNNSIAVKVKDFPTLPSSGFFLYQDSIVFSYEFATGRNVRFSRFSLKDPVPAIERFDIAIGNADRIEVKCEGNNIFISDGVHITVGEMQGRIFVLKSRI